MPRFSSSIIHQPSWSISTEPAWLVLYRPLMAPKDAVSRDYQLQVLCIILFYIHKQNGFSKKLSGTALYQPELRNFVNFLSSNKTIGSQRSSCGYTFAELFAMIVS